MAACARVCVCVCVCVCVAVCGCVVVWLAVCVARGGVHFTMLLVSSSTCVWTLDLESMARSSMTRQVGQQHYSLDQ